MGDYQSSVAAQNIFDVTALEILLASKLQILGQTLPNDEFQHYVFIILFSFIQHLRTVGGQKARVILKKSASSHNKFISMHLFQFTP